MRIIPVRDRSRRSRSARVNLPPKSRECELYWIRADHDEKLQLHHIIPKAWTRKSPEARAYVDGHPELLAWVCQTCNAGTKFADTKRARQWLLKKRAFQHGVGKMRAIVDKIPWRKPKPEWRWEALVDE